MGALLFVDWTVVRASIRQYVLAAGAMVLLVTVMGLPDDAVPVALAAHVHDITVTMGSLMVLFFVLSSLFGVDEREGWEAARLSLPVSRGQVVGARYLSLLLAGLSIVALASVAGALAGMAITWWRFGEPALQPLSDSAVVCVAALATFAAFVAMEMPLLFWRGLSRARAYLTVPFFLSMLVSLEPVRSMAQALAEALGTLVRRLGSPWPVVLSALVVALLSYLLSMLISWRVYARRDF